MDEIVDLVKNYLKIGKSKSAIFISGEWGSGKTHFLLNELKHKIKETGYEVVYVSLNGVESQWQLKRLVLAQCLIGDSNGKPKSGVTLFKDKIKNVITHLQKNENLFNNVFEVSDFVSLDKVLICLDDFERISPNFNYYELMGCINSTFVEHKGYKVLIVGDLSKINDIQTDFDFDKVKEKLISWSIKFNPNRKKIIYQIIESYSRDQYYYDFLVIYRHNIVDWVENFNLSNLRSIIHFLDCLKIVFSHINRRYKEVELEIIFFLLIISYEKRSGLLLNKSAQDLPFFINNSNYIPIVLDELSSIVNVKELPNYDVELRNRFLQYFDFLTQLNTPFEYIFFPELFSLIDFGTLNVATFLQQLDEIVNERKNKQPSEFQEKIRALFKFTKLDDQEYNDIMSTIWKDLPNHDLDIFQYVNLCTLILDLDKYGILNINKNAAITLLSDSMEKTEFSSKITQPRSMFRERDLKPLKALDQSLADKAQKIYENISLKDTQKYNSNLLDNFVMSIGDKSKFLQIIKNGDANAIVEKIFEELTNRNNIQIINDAFCDGYDVLNAGEHYYDHIAKLSIIKDKIEKMSIKGDYGVISKLWLGWLVKGIEDAVKHIEKTKPEKT